MKKSFFSMLFVSIAQLSFGQFSNPFPQKLTELNRHSLYSFDLPKQGKLFIAAKSPKELEEHKNIDSLLSIFAKGYDKIKPALEETTQNRTATFSMKSDGKYFIDIKTHNNVQERYTLGKSNEPLSVKALQDTLVIELGKYRAERPGFGTQIGELIPELLMYYYVVVNNLEDVAELLKNGGVNPKIEQALTDIKTEKNHRNFAERLKFYYRDKGQYFNYSDSLNHANSNSKFWNVRTRRGDVLILHGGLGLGYLGNQWNLSTSISATLVPSKFHNVGYTLGFRSIHSSVSDPVGGFNTSSNNFITAGLIFYDFKKGKQDAEVDITNQRVGLYVGRLVHQGNTLFKENTWSLHASFQVNGLVKVVPELYFNGFFKNAIPGLRLVVGF